MSLRRPLRVIFILVLTVPFLSGCLFRRHGGDDAGAVNPGDQPDKILYEKAVREIEKGRYDVGRLTLQTLINTYPDSEFLSKSKLAIADSYYNEGGVSGLTQAEAEFKDWKQKSLKDEMTFGWEKDQVASYLGKWSKQDLKEFFKIWSQGDIQSVFESWTAKDLRNAFRGWSPSELKAVFGRG